jgi:hypothetical protein
MVLSFYHFTSTRRFLIPTDTENELIIPPEGLIPGRGRYGDTWTDFLWLTTDQNPGGVEIPPSDAGSCVRIEIDLPRNDGKLKRGTTVKWTGEDGVVRNFLDVQPNEEEEEFTKEEWHNMRHCWWVYHHIIPREWCVALDLLHEYPWWWHEVKN